MTYTTMAMTPTVATRVGASSRMKKRWLSAVSRRTTRRAAGSGIWLGSRLRHAHVERAHHDAAERLNTRDLSSRGDVRATDGRNLSQLRSPGPLTGGFRHRGRHRITEPEEGAPSDGWEGNAELPDDVPKGGLPRPPRAVQGRLGSPEIPHWGDS